MSLDPKIKQDWTAALRSGEYGQAREMLMRKNDDDRLSYCCLGVLAKVVGIDGYPSYPQIRSQSGLTTSDQDVLINMNDKDLKNFSEIADYIEENF